MEPVGNSNFSRLDKKNTTQTRTITVTIFIYDTNIFLDKHSATANKSELKCFLAVGCAMGPAAVFDPPVILLLL